MESCQWESERGPKRRLLRPNTAESYAERKSTLRQYELQFTSGVTDCSLSALPDLAKSVKLLQSGHMSSLIGQFNPARPSGGQGPYTEIEAAQLLNVTVDELRSVIQGQILDGSAPPTDMGFRTFQKSDMVLLRILVGQRRSMNNGSSCTL